MLLLVYGSLNLHRLRLPDFTLDVDPSFSASVKFSVTQSNGRASLVTTIYRNDSGRRGEPISSSTVLVSEADRESLAQSMAKVSLFSLVDDEKGNDGETCVLAFTSFPFVTINCWSPDFDGSLRGVEGIAEIENLLRKLSHTEKTAVVPNNFPQPTPPSRRG